MFCKNICSISEIEPDIYLKPSFRISPFRSDDIVKNMKVSAENYELWDDFFSPKKIGYYTNITHSGREAIDLVLKKLNLTVTDKVGIATTSGNVYVSGCVTKTIEKYCLWTRNIDLTCKAIIIIHEFGKNCTNIDVESLKKNGVIIIEDYAHAFSNFFYKPSGLNGDYLIFSLPKFFPIHFGGLLLSKNKNEILTSLHDDNKEFIKSCIQSYLPKIKSFVVERKKIYEYLEKQLSKIKMTAFFQYNEYECPSVYLFKVFLSDETLFSLKTYLQVRGIECSVFYGEKAFFIPCNQSMSKDEIDMVIQLLTIFLKDYI